ARSFLPNIAPLIFDDVGWAQQSSCSFRAWITFAVYEFGFWMRTILGEKIPISLYPNFAASADTFRVDSRINFPFPSCAGIEREFGITILRELHYQSRALDECAFLVAHR